MKNHCIARSGKDSGLSILPKSRLWSACLTLVLQGFSRQEPSPERGALFEAAWFDEPACLYKSVDDFAGGQFYAASDHAVSEAQTANDTCMGLGVYKNGFLYIHPDLVWDRIGPKRCVEEMLRLGEKYKPIRWRAEKGHISKSIMPFLQDQMLARHVFFNVNQESHP